MSTTGADGNATASFTLPPEGGSYRVRVTARTPEGRDVEEHTYLWVSAGAGGYFEGGTEPHRGHRPR